MNTLRYCIACLLLMLAGTSIAAAQTESDDDTQFVRGSNRALAFTLNQLSLDGLNGGIAGRFFIGPQTALRVGANL
ncbi:MAG TPA: hypothetical protein VKP65_09035, partial [Rhodothermales bacterium]|nr:hypothetical protein [Rhodothermales bacterium]